LALLLATAALAAFAPLAIAAPTGCALGWYVVDGAALLEDDAAVEVGSARVRRAGHSSGSSSHGRVVSLTGDQVSIEGICAAAPATLRHKRGRTKVRAAWDECFGVAGADPVTGAFAHPVETLFSGAGTLDGKSAYNILVEPFSTGTLRLRMANTLGVPMQIFHLSSHQHQRGTHFTAWNSAGAKIFENYDWAHPAILDFDDPLVLAPNDFLDYQCEWDNGITRPVRRCGDAAGDAGCTPGDPRAVTFGITAQDEMCFLVGLYYTD
jgi:hypothetical protein